MDEGLKNILEDSNSLMNIPTYNLWADTRSFDDIKDNINTTFPIELYNIRIGKTGEINGGIQPPNTSTHVKTYTPQENTDKPKGMGD